MKTLELNEETEKLLAQVIDAALKAGGLQMHHIVKKLLEGVKDPQSDVK